MTTNTDPTHAGASADDRERTARSDDREKTTRLTVEGIEPDDVTSGFLCDVMEAAEARGLSVAGVSVDRDGRSESDRRGENDGWNESG